MTIVGVLATLDSKHEAAQFMCAALRAAGMTPWLLDLSLRPHAQGVADVGGDLVAQASGTTWQALAALSRADAAQTMIKGGARIVGEKVASGVLSGIVGIGGANGSTMACALMRQLPLAFPKAMVTPVAATAAVQWYVAESDIAMYPTIGDISLNRITRAAMHNAAAAVAGMAKARVSRPAEAANKPLIGLSSFGNLQPAVDRITQRLEAGGYEVIHFHASGPGGRALESLAARGELAGVIDLTTSELADFITGGVYSAGEGRLRAAAGAGVPQVVVPGALDFTNWWVGEVPERYRSRGFFQYNVEILLMRTNAEEFETLGNMIGERLRAAKGAYSVLIPNGFSALTTRRIRDISGNDIGPWAQPETDAVFVNTLRRHVPNENIRELPHHINDAAFADACVDTLLALMQGR
jgi:uncharacterized protein (UPF0261 family)